MIRSMTGYGAAERDTPAGRLSAEVKSVNHRFLSLNVRLPRALEPHESQVRDALKDHIQRGHVNVTLRLEVDGHAAGPRLGLDLERAAEYRRLLTELKDELNLPGEVDVRLLTRFSDLIVAEDEERLELGAEEVRAVVRAAAAAAASMREEEGTSLREDLEGRLRAMRESLEAIEARAPERLVAERDRLRRAVAELAGNVEVDEARLAQELAYLAERWDVSEEIVRLQSHMRLFRETLAAEAGEPVGKRLSFLVQEMHRETNTIGSKANDAAIAHRVIDMKDEIERLREQVDNVE
ncbi:MAG TPA: YicC/YloC family endoribonuclease [Longimicrobiales bacterium]|nr:YicC/YloC family endoribonuclease [Longimicrobiales bacterium]